LGLIPSSFCLAPSVCVSCAAMSLPASVPTLPTWHSCRAAAAANAGPALTCALACVHARTFSLPRIRPVNSALSNFLSPSHPPCLSRRLSQVLKRALTPAPTLLSFFKAKSADEAGSKCGDGGAGSSSFESDTRAQSQVCRNWGEKKRVGRGLGRGGGG
jgi:hypothetical protein